MASAEREGDGVEECPECKIKTGRHKSKDKKRGRPAETTHEVEKKR